jgi:uncharacterized protein (DUF2126 family)
VFIPGAGWVGLDPTSGLLTAEVPFGFAMSVARIMETPRVSAPYTAAVGPTRRVYADKLIRRLREQFAPGGLLHYGQGKCYPGEQLPRWAFTLHWRAGDDSLCTDHALIFCRRRARRRNMST